MTKLVHPDSIRATFAHTMSHMYQNEVPLYGTLLQLVSRINQDVLHEHPELEQELGDLARVSSEKHGAIRLGTAKEMHMMARLFAVMGMHPVGYYNLTVANLPVHSTAFRPVTKESLASNPFRVFCSLLRSDLLNDTIREQAEIQLAKRRIFSPTVIELIELAETQYGLTKDQADLFVKEAVSTFKWHSHAAITKQFYEQLLSINGLVADIIGFKGPHINHLTPRILDIDRLHETMQKEGITMIPAIQGPPKRHCNILLRQTSFQALSEETLFPDPDGSFSKGTHRARFGEIEQRGAALTPKGRQLYDTLLSKVLIQTQEKNPNYLSILHTVFKDFPDDWSIMRKQELAYFEYSPTTKGINTQHALKGLSLDTLVERGYVHAIPITYEDFLPVSAAGIFKSNLVEGGLVQTDATQNREDELANALGTTPLDAFALYEAQQNSSIADTYLALHLQ
jgi:uncharacterized glyoxalase superfamily metalloenzyme YdcJ